MTLFPLTMTEAMVRRRGATLLGPVTHSFQGQGLTIVIGPNGSGKTTLLRALHGIERLSAGSVTWGANQNEARHAQSYVFQSPILLRRSVGQNLAYPLRLDGTPAAVTTQKVQHWADRIGLGDALALPANRLSGGERQKLALARALIRAPQMLFLDEPCANLDGHATKAIESILSETRASGTRIIMSTHDMGQAKRLADDVLFMLHGRVHEQGVAAALFDAPATAELRAFLNGDIVL